MAGHGPAPKDPANRRRSNPPAAGEWKPAPGIGWQHGKMPRTPSGLMPATRTAWKVWFRSWFAAHWTPSDLPAIRQIIYLYDLAERGHTQHLTELRLQLKAYGISPEGQQYLRWTPPKEDVPPATKPASSSRYDHLRAV